MIKQCAHDSMEYVECGDGMIDWVCLDCGVVLAQFEDCKGG